MSSSMALLADVIHCSLHTEFMPNEKKPNILELIEFLVPKI